MTEFRTDFLADTAHDVFYLKSSQSSEVTLSAFIYRTVKLSHDHTITCDSRTYLNFCLKFLTFKMNKEMKNLVMLQMWPLLMLETSVLLTAINESLL